MDIRRRIFLRLTTLLLFELSLTGCEKAVAEGEYVGEFELKSLIGSNKDTVRGRLGKPDRELEGLENDYYVYYANGKFREYIGPIPLPEGPFSTQQRPSTFHCTVLEFDKSGILRRHDTDWWTIRELESAEAKCSRLLPEEATER